MISGGSPTMHPDLLRELSVVSSRDYDMHVTLETEGSVFVEGCAIDLVSLSPKFTNSLPRIGTVTPKGTIITAKHYDRHEKFRMKYDAMRAWITKHDYQYKPVFSRMEDMDEIEWLGKELDIPKTKTWIMPAGGTADELEKRRAPLMEFCWKNGYNYTDRIHIVAYGTKREV
jgi:7-carboxy-7-deazaguanine synthase